MAVTVKTAAPQGQTRKIAFSNKTDTVSMNVTLRHVRVTTSCRGKAISITYSECVDVALVVRHASYYIVICGLSGFTIFFSHYFISSTIFEKIYIYILYIENR